MQNTHICIIAYVWPEKSSSAAGFRTENLVDCFQAEGAKLSFLSPSKLNAFSEKLNQRGIATHQVQANDPNFDRLVKELNPDIVLFDRFVIEEQFGWRVQEHCPNAIRILDTQDLHFLRRSREKALKNKESLAKIFQANLDFFHSDSFREIASIYRCDLSLIISSFEMDLLTSKFQLPDSLLQLFPFCYPEEKIRNKQKVAYEEREHFCFLGNFRHPPNHDACLFLAQKIWPLIRQSLPKTELHIYGAYPPKEIMQLDSPTMGLKVLGPMPEDINNYLQQYRLQLAPLRFGAGIKGKIADSWFAATPVVSSPIGAEGMQLNRSNESSASEQVWGGSIVSVLGPQRDPYAVLENAADSQQHTEQQFIHNFSKTAAVLYQNKKKWEKAQTQSQEILTELFSQTKNATRLIQRIQYLLDNREQCRQQNFIGGMLGEHLHRSTKYFSRWIELKNQV